MVIVASHFIALSDLGSTKRIGQQHTVEIDEAVGSTSVVAIYQKSLAANRPVPEMTTQQEEHQKRLVADFRRHIQRPTEAAVAFYTAQLADLATLR